MRAIGERRFYGSTRVQGAEDVHRFDSGSREFGRDIVRNAGEAEHLNVQRFTVCADCFESRAREILQSQYECPARDRVFHDVRVDRELVPDGGADEIGTVRVEPLLHQQIDLAQVDEAEVKREFFGLRHALPCLRLNRYHLYTIPIPVIYNPLGWYSASAELKGQAADWPSMTFL